MGFDCHCLKDAFCMSHKGRSDQIDYVTPGKKLNKTAQPYAVRAIDRVSRPQRVNLNDAFDDVGNVRGFKPWKSRPYKAGRVRALLIGINYFGTDAELSGCLNDVKQELATFQKKKFPVDEINILVDDPKFPGRTGQPTRANIIRYLAWLAKDAQPGDVLFLHYSGHGVQTKALKDSAEAYDQCIAPVDYTDAGCIVDDDVFDILCSRLPAGVRLTAVMDCCHSGSILDLPFTFMGETGLRSADEHHMKRIRDNNDAKADVLMISGCADHQTSADVGDAASFGNGAVGAGGAATQCLTFTLLKTSKLTYQDMVLRTRDMLRNKSFTQIPQLSSSKAINLQQEFSLLSTFSVDRSIA